MRSRTILQIAVILCTLFTSFAQESKLIQAYKSTRGHSQLLLSKLNYAITNDDLKFVSRVVDSFYIPQPERNYIKGYHPLKHAVQSGSAEVLKILLEAEYEDTLDFYLVNSLFELSFKRGDTTVIDVLLKSGSINSDRKSKMLFEGVHNNNDELIQFIFPKVDSIKPKDYSYFLEKSIKNGSIPSTKLFLTLNLPQNDSSQATNVLSLALINKQDSIFDLLLNAPNCDLEFGTHEGEHIYNGGLTPLMVACTLGNVDAVTKLLSKGADINARSTQSRNHGGTPLMYAAKYGNEACFDALLAAEADYSLRDEDGHSVAATALGNGNMAIINKVLALGFVLEEEIKTVDWILSSPIYDGDIDLFKLLIKHGALKVLPKSQYPLHTAAANGQLEILKILIDSGFSVSKRLPENYKSAGLDVLEIAVLNNEYEVVKFLLKEGEPFNRNLYHPRRRGTRTTSLSVEPKHNSDSVPMLDVIPIEGRIALYSTIKEVDSLYFENNKNQWLALQSYPERSSLSLRHVMTLHKLGATFDSLYTVTDKEGNKQTLTLLQYFIRQGRNHDVEYLLQNGVDVNYTPEGTSPTIFTALYNSFYYRNMNRTSFPIISLLLAFDVDLNSSLDKTLSVPEYIGQLEQRCRSSYVDRNNESLRRITTLKSLLNL